MSVVSIVRAQIGQSPTPANNFVLRAMDDGRVRLSRGNANAESADILIGNPDNTFSVLASPAQFDSSLLLPTTAFVQRALGNMAGYGGLLNATQPIAQSSVGKFFTVSGAVTLSLPTPSAALAGATIELIGVDAANNYTVNVTGGTNISAYSGFSGPSLVCRGGSPVVFRCDGTKWLVVAGADRYRGDWSASLQAGGYMKLPSGVIVQWGSGVVNGSATFSLPIAFPVAPLAAFSSSNNTSPAYAYSANFNNNSQITVVTQGAGAAGAQYLAIGY